MPVKSAQTLILLVLLLVGMSPCVALATDPGHEYSFAIVPQLTPLETARRWTPVINTITRLTGINLRLVHYPSIPIFESRLTEGEPDFAYMNPYHALISHQRQGYIPILRDSKKLLKGILVVRADSPIQSPTDLNNATLAFPAPNAFGASLYMRALLHRKFGINYQSRFVQTHANVYRNVIYKIADAGGGVGRTLRSENTKVRKLLRIIYTTPGVPAHPICAHPRVPEAIRNKIMRAFISMSKDPKQASKLKAIGLSLPVEANFEKDYAPLTQLGLEKYLDANNY